ncbi:hypothetical protein B9Z55_000265 [Caenorhabditis nigoni]|nr:hypothetical protein B9Z55_000265 [Caenorhabditis nigoni]
MSFVSKKIKELIKSSQALRFQSINRIVYGFSVNGLPVVYVPCPGGRIVTFVKQWDKKGFQLNISEKLIDFGILESSYCPVAFLAPSDQESIIRSLHDYFLDFFGNTVEYCWNTKYNPDQEELFIPQLGNLTACSIQNEGGYGQSLKKSAAFFDKAPVVTGQ